MAKQDGNRVDLRPEFAAMIARLGLVPTTIREDRIREAERMHFVGFDNATLLRTSDNPGISMYTNGIIGCNALVMCSPGGAYMAHIDVRILNAAISAQIYHNTERTIEVFTSAIGERPGHADIITENHLVHPGLTGALEDARIGHQIHHDSQFGIAVGARVGSRNINSNINEINPGCEHKNLLDRRLQWPTLTRYPNHYMTPTESSQAREDAAIREVALNRASVIRDNLGGTTPSTTPIENQPYMNHTISSKQKVRDKYITK